MVFKKKIASIGFMNQENNKLPKEVASGIINIGNISIDCSVLEDGKQVISRKSLLQLMGKANPGGRPTAKIISLRNAGVQIPVFVAANNLIPFMPSTLSLTCTQIAFVPLKGGKAQGYNPLMIPDICDTYLDARRAGSTKEGLNTILTKDQLPIAATLEIVARGLSRVGISALVLEACGIVSNEKEYLQKILKQYVNSVLLPWVKRFPNSFFKNYKKMYHLDDEQKIPLHIGHFINNYIYKELSPGVLEELKKLNPINENGRRSHAHHQFLTPNKGVVSLEKQVLLVNTVMSLAKNKSEFDEQYKSIITNINE